MNVSGVHVYHDMTKGLKDVDVLMMLRLQNERMFSARLPSTEEYFKYYGLTQEKLALATARRNCSAPRPHEPGGRNRLGRS